jgi:hypothetical protein
MSHTEEEIIKRFLVLSLEAKKADDEYREELSEIEYDAVVRYVLDNVEHRAIFSDAFVSIVFDPALGPLELVEYCMHALRWDEVKQQMMERLEKEPSERVRSVLRRVLESFDSSWRDADMYRRFTAMPWGRERKNAV